MKRISYNKWCYEKNILQQMVLWKEYPTTNGVMKRIPYNKWCYEKNILQQMVFILFITPFVVGYSFHNTICCRIFFS
jgi:hypothetical protein